MIRVCTLRSFPKGLHVPLRRLYSNGKFRETTTGFDVVWDKMNKEQKDKVIKEYAALESQDWHTLSLEQKRAIYTIAYGSPEVADPYEGWKVFGGVVAVVLAGVGLFAFARSKAAPPPRTLTPEWQRASEEYMRKQNNNPIFGISSRKNEASLDDVKV